MQIVYNLFEWDKSIFKRVVKLIQFKQNYYHRMSKKERGGIIIFIQGIIYNVFLSTKRLR